MLSRSAFSAAASTARKFDARHRLVPPFPFPVATARRFSDGAKERAALQNYPPVTQRARHSPSALFRVRRKSPVRARSQRKTAARMRECLPCEFGVRRKIGRRRRRRQFQPMGQMARARTKKIGLDRNGQSCPFRFCGWRQSAPSKAAREAEAVEPCWQVFLHS